MMKRHFLLLLMVSCTMLLWAVPAKRTTFKHLQSDGTMLTLMLMGDEYGHYYLNTATGQKMLQGEDGDFQLLTDSALNERLTHANLRRSAANRVRQQRLVRFRQMTTNGPRKVGGGINGGMTGSKKGLVILVNFSDKKMVSTHTQTTFDNMFNLEGYNEGGHLGSVHDYFYDQSYGTFDLDFDVVGPVTVSQKMKYYGTNDSEGNDKYPATMLIEACKLVDESVNFADYDWDGDGEVDQVFVVYAGYGENSGASSTTIWPHEWVLSEAVQMGDGTGPLTLDGVKIDTYACTCELAGTSGSVLSGIGTACHEFSHCMGFPDFYDTSYAGGFGMNAWDLLDAGSYNGPNYNGEVPAGYTSYERWCAGWLTPIPLTMPKTVQDMQNLGDSPEAYVIYNDKNSDEFILLENRQNKKWFKYVEDYTTPHGLLAIHVDYDETAWMNNEPNNVASHQRMCIIPSSGVFGEKESYYGQIMYSCSQSQFNAHPFSGSSTKTALTATSNTSSGGKWFKACSTGSTSLNHEVTSITNAKDGTISFLFDGGTPVDDGRRYTLTFNSCAGLCDTYQWTQSAFQETITLPSCTSPADSLTFVGWSTEELLQSTTAKPTLLTAGTVSTPTESTTLYAVFSYVCKDGGVPGFVLSQDYKGTTYFVNEADAANTRFNSSTQSGLTLFYHDGYLWYNDNGTATYVSNSSSSSHKLNFTTTQPSTKWTMTETDEGVKFITNSQYLSLTTTSNYFGYIRVYPGTYSTTVWNLTYTGEVSAAEGASLTYYTSYPMVDLASAGH